MRLRLRPCFAAVLAALCVGATASAAGGAEMTRLTSVSGASEPWSPAVRPLALTGRFECRAVAGGAGSGGARFSVRAVALMADAAGGVVWRCEREFPFAFPDGITATYRHAVDCEIPFDGLRSDGGFVPDGTYAYELSGTYLRHDVLGNGKIQTKEIARAIRWMETATASRKGLPRTTTPSRSCWTTERDATSRCTGRWARRS